MRIPFDGILRHRTMRNFIRECMHLCVAAAHFSLVEMALFFPWLLFQFRTANNPCTGMCISCASLLYREQ